MSSENEVQKGRLAGRLIAFYIIIAAITIPVVIAVVNHGRNEKAQPIIAGGYDVKGLNPCIGSVPPPPTGPALPATAPTQPTPAGPSFIVQQSGQFVNLTNNLRTLGGQLRLHTAEPARGRAQADRHGQLRHRRQQEARCDGDPRLQGRRSRARSTASRSRRRSSATRRTPAPRCRATPSDIDGMYQLSPRSACFGGTFVLKGSGSSYHARGQDARARHGHLHDQDGDGLRRRRLHRAAATCG